MKKELIPLNLLLTFIVLFLQPQIVRSITFNENFDSIGALIEDFYDGDSNADCGDFAKLDSVGNLVYDSDYDLYICNGAVGGATTSSLVVTNDTPDDFYARGSFGTSGNWAGVLMFRYICGEGELCYLNNDTRIYYDFDGTTTFDSAVPASIGFFNSLETISNPSSDPQNFNPDTRPFYIGHQDAGCSLDDFFGDMDGWKTLNFTLGELTGCTVPYRNYTKPIDTFYFYFWNDDQDGAVADFQYLDNLTISGLVNSSNSLPSFNVTVSESLVCVDSSDLDVKFNFTIDAYDPDGDTILYGNNNVPNTLVIANYTENTIDFEELRSIFGLSCNTLSWYCSYGRDYSDLVNFVSKNDSCVINENGYDLFKHNLVIEGDVVGTNRVYLELNPLCDGKNEILYELPDKASDTWIDATFKVEPNITFNMSLAKYDYAVKYRLFFNVTDTNVTVSYFDGVNDQKVLESPYAEDIVFRFDSRGVAQNDFANLFLKSASNTFYYSTNLNLSNVLSTDVINYLIIESDGKLLLDEFFMQSILTEFQYDSKPLDHFNVTGYGNFFFDVFVTDSFNVLSDEYATDRIYVTVAEPAVCDSTLFITGADADGDFVGSIRPDTGWESLDDIIEALRQFYLIAKETGTVAFLRTGVLVGIFAFIALLFKNLVFGAQQSFDNTMRIAAVMMMVLVGILYVMLLVNQTIFVIFSMIGLLYLSYEILNISGSTSAGTSEENFMYIAAMFTVLQGIWFSIIQVVSIERFFPVFPDLVWSFNVDVLFANAGSLLLYMFKMLFFSIPDLPLAISGLLVFVKILGVLSLTLVSWNKIRGI